MARYVNAYQQNTADQLTTMSEHSLAPEGGSSPHNNAMPYLGLTFCVCIEGVVPQRPA